MIDPQQPRAERRDQLLRERAHLLALLRALEAPAEPEPVHPAPHLFAPPEAVERMRKRIA